MATFQRPDLLKVVLQSLAEQVLGDIQMRIVVIDNDKNETARAIVESFRNRVTFDVVYDVEPCQNISMARNRALSHAHADYVAFIDDDEIAPAGWLATLRATLEKYKADVVFAPVWGLLPPNAPKWACSFFYRHRIVTGSPVRFGGTGNVLIRRNALGEPPQQFDSAYGLSGGEDTDYFNRLYQKGMRMVWCDEALVTEHVPENRLTIKWVRQRGFGSGQSYARIFGCRYPMPKKIAWVVLKVMQLLVETGLMLLSRIVSYSLYVRRSVKVMGTLGQLSVVFSDSVNERYRENK